jgi:hypothetical protein
MSTRVYTAVLCAEVLTAIIACLGSESKERCAILERPDKVDFPDPQDPIDPTAWARGRIFDEQTELYWERDDETYQVRYTRAGEAEPLPGFEEVLVLDDPGPDRVWYYLWGEKEMAIGGRLDYSRAIPGVGRGQLLVEEHRDKDGRLIFYRYAGLKRESDDGG